MSLQSIIINDLKVICRDLDYPTITYRQEDFQCIPSSDSSTTLLEIGGFSENADITFTVRKELFTDFIPTAQELITYKGTLYRILTIKEDTTGAFYRLICVDKSRGV